MKGLDLLPLCQEKGLPFFSYRLPDTEAVIVGVQRSPELELVSDFDALDISRKGFLVAPFLFGEGHPAYFLKADWEMDGESLVSLDWNSLGTEEPSHHISLGQPATPLSKVDYFQRVNHLIEKIRQGEVGKVVFSRSLLSSTGQDFDWLGAYRQILAECTHAFVYCLYIPKEGLWMGASPELLLRKKGKNVETVALAGTMQASSSSWSTKNSEEQALVVRYIAEALRRSDVEEVKTEGPVSVLAGNVCHLKTFFSATLPDESKALSLLKALHPTPAVCGYPKQTAMDLIRSTELTDRSFYSGFLGPVDGGNFDFHVNLRCMRVYADAAELFVGGGIMENSDAEDEWNETILKSKTMNRFVREKA